MGGKTPLDEADLNRVPEILHQPEAILFDKRQNTPILLYVFSPVGDNKKGKLVVKIDLYRTGRVIGKDKMRRKVKVNPIRTSGYVDVQDLRTEQYELVIGELK